MNNDYFRLEYNKKRDKIWKVLCAYLQKFIPYNSVVLDLGAGYCKFINNIKCRKKYAIDIFDKFYLNADKEVICKVMSSEHLDFLENNSIDIIFASNFFEHISKIQFDNTMKEIKRILKRGGRLIIIQPNYKFCYKDYFDDHAHQQIFSHISLKDVLHNYNFRIIKLVPRFLPFSMKSGLPASPFLLKIYLSLPFKPFAKQMLIISKNH